jgi:arsenate reductase
VKRVLFVCVQNSFRSQMAEGFARQLGTGVVEAFSAGSRPSGVVSPKAIEAMKEVGIDISSHASKVFDKLPNVEWDAIVTMGCGDACPHLPAKRRFDWNIPEPRNMPKEEFNKVRDDIRQKVIELLETLSQ